MDTFFHVVDPIPKQYYDLKVQDRRKKLQPSQQLTILPPTPIIEEKQDEVVEPKQETKSDSTKKSRRRKSD